MAKAKTPRTTPTNKQVLTMPEAGSVPTVRKISPPVSSPSVDLAAQIRERAYQLSQERGGAPGHENEDWLRAEREVIARQSHQQTA
jgi:Protein of unknown function (DUF2934)